MARSDTATLRDYIPSSPLGWLMVIVTLNVGGLLVRGDYRVGLIGLLLLAMALLVLPLAQAYK